jgi:hypothetical protein
MLARLAFAALVALTAPGFAQAADVAPMMDYGAGAPSTACSSFAVLGRIKARFESAEVRTWHRGYKIRSIENPRPSGHPYAEPGIIKRDYCMAESLMTNGDVRTIYYVVEHGVGFAGIGSYVDFCVFGLDPWHVHDGSCRAVR